MLAENSKGVSIDIMGKQHQFACSAEQTEDLKQAIHKLTMMCNDIKQQSESGNNERALLVAAVNLSYSLLIANNKIEDYQQGQSDLLAKLKCALK